jgi:hypothetical protein
MNRVITYIFIISVVLVLAVYYLGVTNDLSTFTNAFVSLIQVATGRNAQGQFASYPNGSSPTVAATAPFGTAPALAPTPAV